MSAADSGQAAAALLVFAHACAEQGGIPAMMLRQWEAKHWILASLIIVIAVGAFAYSWS